MQYILFYCFEISSIVQKIQTGDRYCKFNYSYYNSMAPVATEIKISFISFEKLNILTWDSMKIDLLLELAHSGHSRNCMFCHFGDGF